MVHEMILRSVYLRPDEDGQLRQLAHELNVTKSDLIRAAISIKLAEWLKCVDTGKILADVERGRSPASARRSRATLTKGARDAG